MDILNCFNSALIEKEWTKLCTCLLHQYYLMYMLFKRTLKNDSYTRTTTTTVSDIYSAIDGASIDI